MTFFLFLFVVSFPGGSWFIFPFGIRFSRNVFLALSPWSIISCRFSFIFSFFRAFFFLLIFRIRLCWQFGCSLRCLYMLCLWFSPATLWFLPRRTFSICFSRWFRLSLWCFVCLLISSTAGCSVGISSDGDIHTCCFAKEPKKRLAVRKWGIKLVKVRNINI